MANKEEEHKSLTVREMVGNVQNTDLAQITQRVKNIVALNESVPTERHQQALLAHRFEGREFEDRFTYLRAFGFNHSEVLETLHGFAGAIKTVLVNNSYEKGSDSWYAIKSTSSKGGNMTGNTMAIENTLIDRYLRNFVASSLAIPLGNDLEGKEHNDLYRLVKVWPHLSDEEKVDVGGLAAYKALKAAAPGIMSSNYLQRFAAKGGFQILRKVEKIGPLRMATYAGRQLIANPINKYRFKHAETNVVSDELYQAVNARIDAITREANRSGKQSALTDDTPFRFVQAREGLLRSNCNCVRLDDPSSPDHERGYARLGAGKGTVDGDTHESRIIISLPRTQLENVPKDGKFQMGVNCNVVKVNVLTAKRPSSDSMNISDIPTEHEGASVTNKPTSSKPRAI